MSLAHGDLLPAKEHFMGKPFGRGRERVLRAPAVGRAAARAALALGAALVAPALAAGCFSSTSNSGSTADASCTPTEASVTAFLTMDAGPPRCQACVTTMCTEQVNTCSGDCQCNDSAV